jgi:glutamate synthase (NADPH/NADH) small chain
MGNPTGFINVGRALPTERDAGERLIDWLEVYEEIPLKAVEKQASRCMANRHNQSLPLLLQVAL